MGLTGGDKHPHFKFLDGRVCQPRHIGGKPDELRMLKATVTGRMSDISVRDPHIPTRVSHSHARRTWETSLADCRCILGDRRIVEHSGADGTELFVIMRTGNTIEDSSENGA